MAMKASVELNVFVEIRKDSGAIDYLFARDGAFLCVRGEVGKYDQAQIRIDGKCSDAELSEAHRVAREAFERVTEK